MSERVLINSEVHKRIQGEPPSFFGAEGERRQETVITDVPLEVSRSDYDTLSQIVSEVITSIDTFPERELFKVGVEGGIVEDYLRFDGKSGGLFMYGGLDVYKSDKLGFKVLEINSLVQAMGLQDYRLASLGIFDQPMIAQHFLEEILNRGCEHVLVLGSRRNPFWRAHDRVSQLINEYGVDCKYSDMANFESLYDSGFRPDFVLRFCNSNHLLYSSEGGFLRNVILENAVPVVNAVSSPLFGSRGFLHKLSERSPNLMPAQIQFDVNSGLSEFQKYPWIKIETRDLSYVANFNELRKWGRDCLLALQKKDFSTYGSIISDKNGGDAEKLRELSRALVASTEDEVRWIGQENVEPLEVVLPIAGNDSILKVLHRVYWVRTAEGVKVSMEGFGCTKEQYSKSKNKINGGTGISVPMVIK